MNELFANGYRIRYLTLEYWTDRTNFSSTGIYEFGSYGMKLKKIKNTEDSIVTVVMNTRIWNQIEC